MSSGLVPFGGSRQFENLFGRFFSDALTGRQDMDALRTHMDGQDVLYDFDVPGLSDDEISVDLSRDVLTVTGEHKESDENGSYATRSIRQSVALPEGSDFDKITASLDKGVLTVRVPVPSTDTTDRKIEITKG